MPSTFQDRRRIEFYETDMAGIVHFSNFFRFMEATEHAFFRSLGLALHENDGTRMSGWARVQAQCEYRTPLHYMDEIEVVLRVSKKTETSLAYDFVIRRVADRRGPTQVIEVAQGALQVVHVARNGAGPMKACAMPEAVARVIDVASKEPGPLHP